MNNQELQRIQERILTLPKLVANIHELNNTIPLKTKEYKKLLKKYENEKVDVERLEKDSLSAYIYRLLGKLEEKKDKEVQEMLEAKLEFDEISSQLQYMEKELEIAVATQEEIEKEVSIYTDIINIRRSKVKESTDNVGYDNYIKVTSNIDALEKEKVELQEALRAAYNAYRTASEAASHLSSAESIATYDIFVKGGMLTHAAKYDHIDDAEKLIHKLTSQIRILQRELQDVKSISYINVEEISSTERAVDYFFDNIFTDYNVREKIRGNKSEIDRVVNVISSTIERLERQIKVVESKITNEKTKLEEILIHMDFDFLVL